SQTVEVEEKCNESKEDSEDEPMIKKSKKEPVENEGKRRASIKGSSQSETVQKDHEHKQKSDLQCFECEYRSRSVMAWKAHLRIKHSTTPDLAGYLLRCDCGHESRAHEHSYKCPISNFTVIREGNGPIRRL
ncbi:hypothetical protein PMAYCL1PPCAC_13977, partial [Pristionchus mayeri]